MGPGAEGEDQGKGGGEGRKGARIYWGSKYHVREWNPKFPRDVGTWGSKVSTRR